jgi:hypothetical protein
MPGTFRRIAFGIICNLTITGIWLTKVDSETTQDIAVPPGGVRGDESLGAGLRGAGDNAIMSSFRACSRRPPLRYDKCRESLAGQNAEC